VEAAVATGAATAEAAVASGVVAVEVVADTAVAAVAARAVDRGSAPPEFIVAQRARATIFGFAKHLIQEIKTWPSNARFRSSNPTLSRRT
jgi:hypothetical protein